MTRLLTLTLILLTLTACSTFTTESGSLALRSRSDTDLRLNIHADHAIYALGDKQSLTALLINGPVDNPSRVVILRVAWTPKAGATPVSKRATNAAIQTLVFIDRDQPALRELGIYGGAGYVFLNDDPGERIVKGEIWDAHLNLTDRSLGFRDRLGTSTLTGSIQLRRDDQAVLQLLNRFSQQVSQTLDYPRLVAR